MRKGQRHLPGEATEENRRFYEALSSNKHERFLGREMNKKRLILQKIIEADRPLFPGKTFEILDVVSVPSLETIYLVASLPKFWNNIQNRH